MNSKSVCPKCGNIHDAGVSQSALARIAGVTRATINNILAKKTDIALATADKIATVFGVPVGRILDTRKKSTR
jgi:plasmid maintenance system antidote protein VapI